MGEADHVVVVSDMKRRHLDIEREVFAGLDVDLRHGQFHEEADLLAAASDADGLVVDASTPVTPSVLSELPRLRIVARAGIGVDNLPLAAAEARGVWVTNVPDYAVEEVSDHAVGMLLGLGRGIPAYTASVEDGDWDWTAAGELGRLAERTLGVLAFGRIGRRTVAKARPVFGDVLVCDPYVDDERIREAGAEPVEFRSMLVRADALSVHAPLTDDTRGMLDREAFATLGPDAIVVNTARGEVVDESALRGALEVGDVAAAGLDVLVEEPPTDRRLLDREDVLVTPHVAWYSEESADEVRRKAARQVRSVLEGGTPEYAVSTDDPWR